MIKTIKKTYNLIRFKIRDFKVDKKRSPKWNSVQKDFLSKHPTCALCGDNKKLNVHHKKPFHLYPELELDENNLITLCMGDKECHLLIGHGDNFSFFCPDIELYVEEYKTGKKTFDELKIIAMKERKK